MRPLLVFCCLLFTYLQATSQCLNDTLTIGHDTTLCTGQSITLSADQAYLNYLWSNNATTSSINVSSAGVYTCTATIMDSSNLVFNGDFFFGNMFFNSNYIYGTGGAYGLLSNEGQYAISTNASNTHINFSACTDHTSGTGNFMIVNGASTLNQKVWYQTISVVPSTTYIFSAWFTSVHSSNPAVLNFAINNIAIGNNVSLSSTTCLWQNFYHTWTSGPTQTQATISITNQNIATGGNDFAIDDIYFAQICEFQDTVMVNYNNYPNVNLGNDTTICLGDSMIVDATADSISNYLWQDSSTLPLYSSYGNDSLWVKVSNGYCSSYDTIIINGEAQLSVDLGNDTVICDGSPMTLDAQNPGTDYLWQDQSKSQTYAVTTTGLYWVNVKGLACSASDSINIIYGSIPNPVLDKNYAFCERDSVLLNPGTFYHYLWSNGSNQKSIWAHPSSQTNYGVVVSDSVFCSDSITTSVEPIPYPMLLVSSADDTLCKGEYTLLSATGADDYQWLSGPAADQWNVQPLVSTNYTISGINELFGVQCTSDSSIKIVVENCNRLYIPNAFTPDDDGLNDLFGPIADEHYVSYTFIIYDRWGKVQFYTQDLNTFWDGCDKQGEPLPGGVYTYIILTKSEFGEEFQRTGTVHLIK